MAACGLRHIRYVTFPPVVFVTPAPVPAPPPEAEPPPVMTVEPPSAPVAVAAGGAARVTEVAGLPVPAQDGPSPPPAPPPMPAAPAAIEAAMPLPAAPRPGMRRLAEFAAELAEVRGAARAAPPAHPAPPDGLPPGMVPLRQYALLQDIAGELRPRRVRARAGKRA